MTLVIGLLVLLGLAGLSDSGAAGLVLIVLAYGLVWLMVVGG